MTACQSSPYARAMLDKAKANFPEGSFEAALEVGSIECDFVALLTRMFFFLTEYMH